jgi:hypothetical protein
VKKITNSLDFSPLNIFISGCRQVENGGFRLSGLVKYFTSNTITVNKRLTKTTRYKTTQGEDYGEH